MATSGANPRRRGNTSPLADAAPGAWNDSPMLGDRFFFDAAASIRATDLLTPDQPLKPVPLLHPVRFHAAIRLVVFLAVFGVAYVVEAMVAGAAILLAYSDSFGPFDMTRLPWAVTVVFRMYPLAAPPIELVAAVVAYIVLTCALEKRAWPFELAWRRFRAVWKGLLLGFVGIAVCIAILAAIGDYRIVGLNLGYNPLADLVGAGFTAAIAEEIMFRGVVFRVVDDWFGSWAAVAVSSLLFGFAHLTNPDATLVGAIGIVIEAGLLFAAVYLATRNLWVTMGLHFAWNMAEGPIFGSIVSGSSDTASGWIQASWTGPDWLTGGQFGLEASVVPIVVLGAVSVWLLVRVQRHGGIVAPSWVRKRQLLARSGEESPLAS